jgi:hypothetical protein
MRKFKIGMLFRAYIINLLLATVSEDNVAKVRDLRNECWGNGRINCDHNLRPIDGVIQFAEAFGRAILNLSEPLTTHYFIREQPKTRQS